MDAGNYFDNPLHVLKILQRWSYKDGHCILNFTILQIFGNHYILHNYASCIVHTRLMLIAQQGSKLQLIRLPICN